jgi:hypothetical protein
LKVGQRLARMKAVGRTGDSGMTGSGVPLAVAPASSPSRLGEHLVPFVRAPVELLRGRELLRRTDTKFLLSEERLEALLARLRESYGVLATGPNTVGTYATEYLDTEELRCFEDHRRGRRLRQKVRVRSYPDRGLSFVEVKSRRSDVWTVKHRRERPLGGGPLCRDERAFVSEHCSFPAEGLEPVVRVHYRRALLLSRETRERVTIDADLSVIRGTQVEKLAGIAIVEVKQPSFRASTPAMRALRACRLRPIALSKYCAAVVLTHEGIRCNRLLPALRQLERMRS